MDWTDREVELLEQATGEKPCDASQAELLAMIDRLETKLYEYNQAVLTERKRATRWKRWAKWVWTINYRKPDPIFREPSPGQLPSRVVRETLRQIKEIAERSQEALKSYESRRSSRGKK